MRDLQDSMKSWMEERDYQSFDCFLIRQMGYRLQDRVDMDTRRSAYHTFLSKISKPHPASAPTMKRWFGLGGFSVPGRETVFAICFSLGLDEKQTGIFLTEGLREPSFQINDYLEIIYLYGLEHGLSQEECDDLAREYESGLDIGVPFCRTHSTHELQKQYQSKKNLPKKEFLSWMVENAKFFKGYSQTVLDYFLRYKKLISESMREDAQIVLRTLLEETEYAAWKRRRFIRETNLETIRRFVYSKKTIDENLRENILEMARMSYSGEQPNALFIREMFSFRYEELPVFVKERGLFRMTEKRMSDLLSSALHRERYMRSVIGIHSLEKLRDEARCPGEVRRLLTELDADAAAFEQMSVGKAREWLTRYQKKQRRRCLLIQRGDILPLVVYMVQRNYMKEISYDMGRYSAEQAIRYFEEVANATLSACNMAPLHKGYESDALFYLCFQKTEMYFLADVLDMLEQILQNK